MMYRKVHKIGWFLGVLFLFFGITLSAQGEKIASERKAIGAEAIVDLKEGALLVRLPSKRRKIQHLEGLIADRDLAEKTRKRLRKDLENTINERNRYNIQLTKAFDSLFTFTEVYFLYDSAMVVLNKGERSGFFLDKNLELDQNKTLKTEQFLVARIGSTDASKTTAIEAIVIMDKKGKDLERPFPYYVRSNGFGRVLLGIFFPKKRLKKDAYRTVAKLNKQLGKFFVVVEEEREQQDAMN